MRSARGRTFAAGLRLLRPLNVVTTAAGVVLGGGLAGGAPALASGALWTAALAAALVAGGANALNDALDVDIDRVNRPARPVPSGAVSVRAAEGVWMGTTAAGVALGVAVSPWHGASALAVAAVLAVYARYLKRTPLVGNVVVAAAVAFTLVYGARVGSGARAVLVAAAFAFAVNVAREIAKSIEDAPGDAHVGARTLPLAWGARPSAALAALVTAGTLAALPLPYLAAGASGLYLLGALPAAAGLATALARLAPPVTTARAGQASAALKAALLFGLAALAAGGR